MEIKQYEDKYKNQVIALVLFIQNYDNKVDLSLADQPDLKDIYANYIEGGGGFWIALNHNDDVVGTIGLMKKKDGYGILKKFFVLWDYRGRNAGVSSGLYSKLLEQARRENIMHIVLDTPSACHRAHAFYHRMGYRRIHKDELPIQYDYPDRDSIIFITDLDKNHNEWDAPMK